MNSERESWWEELYRNEDLKSLPWFYPGLDHDFEEALKKYDIRSGTVLDLCTGPGTQALAMAERGFSVTAADIAETAVKKACLQAREMGMDIVFKQNDILTGRFEETFDLVLDRGCYHVFPDDERKMYIPAVGHLINFGGFLLLKCFSTREKRRDGPHRIDPEEIRERFKAWFEILSIEHTVFKSVHRGNEPKALFCVMRKSSPNR